MITGGMLFLKRALRVIVLLVGLKLGICEGTKDTAIENGVVVFNAQNNIYNPSKMKNSVAQEYMLILAAIGGVVNRNRPQFFVNGTSKDQFWYSKLSQDENSWLHNKKIILRTDDILKVVTYFISYFHNGVVLYDSTVPSTSNIAATLAGIHDLLPILDQGILYHDLILNGPKLKANKTLVNKFNGSLTGSKKNDPYEWFRLNYMVPRNNDNNKYNFNPTVMGYLIDMWWVENVPSVDRQSLAIINADYIIANRGLIFDLDVWDDQKPNDDPNANRIGIDYETLNSIMGTAYNPNVMIHIIGFVPWAFKYVNSKHPGVASEWQASMLFTGYNAYVDADACCDINTMVRFFFCLY